MGLAGKRGVQILAGLRIIMLESHGLLKLPDRLPGAALLVESATQVIVGLGLTL